MNPLKTGDEGAAASAVAETESVDASELAEATKPAEEEPADVKASMDIEDAEDAATESSKEAAEAEEAGSTDAEGASAEASKEAAEAGSTDSDEQEEKDFVQREVERIQEFVGSLSLDDLQGGDWFVKLLAFSLSQYVKEVDAEYFKEKYPNVPPDAIVDKRIQMAANHAAIEGALSSAAYTGAVAATIGSGGGASPLTLPAGGLSFIVDMSYTSYLQLQLAHDISVLYGVPIDINDPDDTWKLVRLAFGIKLSETANNALLKGLPAFIRPIVKQIFSGSTLAALKSLPVVGKHLLQRNIIKFAIPGITIPITTAVNWWTTQAAGDFAKNMLRKEAKIIETSKRIVDRAESVEAVLAALWWIVNVDNTIQEEELLLLHHITVAAERDAKNGEEYQQYIEAFKQQIEVDEEDLWERISLVSEAGAPRLYRAAVIAAAVDGDISKEEHELLKQLADRLGIEHDKRLIEVTQRQWK